MLALAALGAGGALGWRLGSPSVVWPPSNPEQALRNAAMATLHATSYTVDESVFLGGSSGEGPGTPFETVRTVQQGPDRFKVNFPYSIVAPASIVVIGTDCWIAGVPSTAIASGSFSCGSVANKDSLDGLLRSFEAAVGVEVSGRDLTLQPKNPAAFLAQSGVRLSGLAASTVKVQVTLDGPYIGTVTISGSATPPADSGLPSLTGSVGIGFSAIGSSTVSRPPGPPTEVNGKVPGAGST